MSVVLYISNALVSQDWSSYKDRKSPANRDISARFFPTAQDISVVSNAVVVDIIAFENTGTCCTHALVQVGFLS